MESICLDKVSFSYREGGRRGQERFVLKEADLTVYQGEIICICGASGQGKSTLLRVIAGLERPSNGRLTYFGVEADLEEHTALTVAARRVGFVFQNCALISNLTVANNVALPLRYHGVCSEEDIPSRVNQVLSSMMVEEFSEYFPYTLSMGIQKRVAIARALAMDPAMLLMDEPTAGLDNVNRRSLLALIANLRALRHATILIVTHDLLIAKELNSKLCFLHDGFLTQPVYFEQLAETEYEFVKDLVKDLQQEAQLG